MLKDDLVKLKEQSFSSAFERSVKVQEVIDVAMKRKPRNVSQDVVNEVNELLVEVSNLNEAHSSYDKERVRQRVFEEFGDVLLVLSNLARVLNIDCDKALELSLKELERRMLYVEEVTKKTLDKVPERVFNELWKQVKQDKSFKFDE